MNLLLDFQGQKLIEILLISPHLYAVFKKLIDKFQHLFSRIIRGEGRGKEGKSGFINF